MVDQPGQEDRKYPTWVDDIKPPFLTIAPPMEREHVIILSPGQKVAAFWDEVRGSFALEAVVRERRAATGQVTLEVTGIKRLQRRRYFRWQGDYEVWFQLLETGAAEEEEEEEEEELLLEPEWREARTFDLSGGGLSLRLNEELAMGTDLLLELRLPVDTINAEGRVVRVRANKQDEKGKYLVGVEFTRISEAAQRKVMQFLFNEQVRFRRG